MFDIASLRWSSRDDAANALLDIAQTGSKSLSSNAARLLEIVAPPSFADDFLRLGRSRDRPYFVRAHALRGFAKTGAVAPLSVIRELFDEKAPDEGDEVDVCPICWPEISRAPAFLDISGVVRGPDQEALTCDWLSRATPDVRRALLYECARLVTPPSPAIVERLFALWCGDVASNGASRADADCAPWLAPRPEARRIQLAYWRQHTKSDPDFFDALRDDSTLDVLLDGPLRVEAARRFLLTLPDELAALGASELGAEALAAVRDASARLRHLEDHRPEDKEDPRHDLRIGGRREQRYTGVLDVIETWSEGPAIATELLRDSALVAAVRVRVALALFRSDRLAAFRAVTSSPMSEDCPDALRAVVNAAEWGPDAIDRTFLRAVAPMPDEDVSHGAVEALETLGEDGDAWLDVLRGIARHGGPLARVRAAGALARRGDRAHESALVEAVAARSDGYSIAIRCLGELDGAERYFSLFEGALALPFSLPTSAEVAWQLNDAAAIALGRIGGEAAISALLRGYLRGASCYGERLVESILAVLCDERDPPNSASERHARVRAASARGTAWDPYRFIPWTADDGTTRARWRQYHATPIHMIGREFRRRSQAST